MIRGCVALLLVASGGLMVPKVMAVGDAIAPQPTIEQVTTGR